MKALTLYQPYATLIAIGAKGNETRSWPTHYRGPIAIHVSKRIPLDSRVLCGWGAPEIFQDVLKDIFWTCTVNEFGTSYQGHPENFHLGCIIATCDLVDCIPTQICRICLKEDVERRNRAYPQFHWISYQEDDFGDYTPGRFAWILANVKPLPEPIPARGSLGLWEWNHEI